MSDRRFLTGGSAGNGSLYPTWRAGAGSDERDRGSALRDRAAVTRVRPIGEPNDRALRASGPSPLAGRRPFCKKHDIDPNIVTHHSVHRNCQLLTAGPSHRRFDLKLFLSRLAAMRHSPDPGRVVRRMCRFIARPLTQTPYRVVDLNRASL